MIPDVVGRGGAVDVVKFFNLGKLRDISVLVWNLGMGDRDEKILWCEHPLRFLYPASRQGMQNHT